ncbi:MAG: large conductance mechanosensitive channel protein MscL [Rhodospirillaceae bacterium]|nr:MAG: large conductance mechanosensitive channel protein MscL [Rhodospirillaceae bacterium]
MLKEFREFIERGNVIDLAVAFILGLAFNGIVKSLVNDIIMPLVGLVTGGADFSNRFIVLGSGSFETLAAAQEAGVATLNYGVFINTTIEFIIIAFVLFMAVRTYNRFKRKQEAEPAEAAEPAAPPRQEVLLEEIRDALRSPAS